MEGSPLFPFLESLGIPRLLIVPFVESLGIPRDVALGSFSVAVSYKETILAGSKRFDSVWFRFA